MLARMWGTFIHYWSECKLVIATMEVTMEVSQKKKKKGKIETIL